MLTDTKGMTLYYFDRDDTGNKSNCNGKCNERWVPLTASKDDQPTGDFTVITRDDGSKMWAYRYRPLYTSQADKTPARPTAPIRPRNGTSRGRRSELALPLREIEA